ncbi:glycine cleavage system protein H [Mycolicibacterium agri]|uniref:Glycine cleavage system H protein n=1 Tax=Mycolicibacterium agri TaxID=36811 RepID=A0A2A7MRR9_MYCAG|nr:glycine cleavage system protein GcvH [Mycolicibacterium agri]PEG33818.1 glycine cleavage system protein H [Mycolicibacterium agri]GFG52443.1 glycine cleavage system H protein [Mycolicibacterium agri]
MSGLSFPNDRSYTEEHEWVQLAPDAAMPNTPVRVGITAVAVAALGELVYLDLPEVGATVIAGQACGEVESTKTVSELFPPVSGEVTEVNNAAIEDPSLVNTDPYGVGWLFAVRATAAGPLLSATEYAQKNGN